MTAEVNADRLGAVAKVVRVVEALTEHRGVGELGRATGLPTSTVHRILGELSELGWARRDGERGYLPGVGLLTVAARAESVSALTSVVRPVAERLRDATSHTVHFAMRQADQIVYVVKVEGQRAYAMKSRIGLAVPLHSTGIGKAVLAALPAAELHGVVTRTGLPPMTPNTITDEGELTRHLALTARRGYALDDGENERHLRCIAAVVHDYRGTPVGGLSLSAITLDLDRTQVREYVPLVVAAAREISQGLGAGGR